MSAVLISPFVLRTNFLHEYSLTVVGVQIFMENISWDYLRNGYVGMTNYIWWFAWGVLENTCAVESHVMMHHLELRSCLNKCWGAHLKFLTLTLVLVVRDKKCEERHWHVLVCLHVKGRNLNRQIFLNFVTFYWISKTEATTQLMPSEPIECIECRAKFHTSNK